MTSSGAWRQPLLLASATQDPYSQDAADVIETAARPAYETLGAAEALEHLRVDAEHRLTADRFERIVEWTEEQDRALSSAATPRRKRQRAVRARRAPPP